MTDPDPPFILGVTIWDRSLPDRLGRDQALRVGDLALLASDARESAQHRLRRQMHWCRAGIDVLPISPNAPLSLTAAQGLLDTRGPALRQALARLQGQIEIIVHHSLPSGVDPDRSAAPRAGQTWLRHRAAVLAAQRQAAECLDAALSDLLDALTSPASWQSVALTIPADARNTRLRRAVLLPRGAQHPFGKALAERIAAEKWAGAWALLAPLPPLNFATLGG